MSDSQPSSAGYNSGNQNLKILTVADVLKHAKATKPEEVVRLKIWFKGIEDISVLSQFPNLAIVSLTDNRISSLKCFQNSFQLQELFVRKNRISDIREIEYLRGLKSLRVLWAADNPVAETPEYRPQVIRILPQLYKLDETNLTATERLEAAGSTKLADIMDDLTPLAPLHQLKPLEFPSVLQQKDSVDLLQHDMRGSEPHKFASVPAEPKLAVRLEDRFSRYSEEPAFKPIIETKENRWRSRSREPAWAKNAGLRDKSPELLSKNVQSPQKDGFTAKGAKICQSIVNLLDILTQEELDSLFGMLHTNYYKK